jgi:hypothetical protein
VIVALPAAAPVARPDWLMLATLAFELLHCTEPVTSFVLPSESFAVTENCWVAPTATEAEAGEICIDDIEGEEGEEGEPFP